MRAKGILFALVVAAAVVDVLALQELRESRVVLLTPAGLRLAGKLDQARQEVEARLGQQNLAVSDEIALRLELAKIYDRVGLHTNSRPVAAALREIERADALSVNLNLDAATRGAVEAAKANYYYRAEMAQRKFTRATAHARRAINLLHDAVDTRAQSDAVHQLGLIHLQMREFDRARELFDESLTLDRAAGERAWMLGEYHRHVGLIDVFKGDWKAALPHLESSLRFRKEAGAIDASLFAAILLGSALIETGNPKAAGSHLDYAVEIARSIPSPVGTARASIVLGKMYERLGKNAEARVAYKVALVAANSVDYATLVGRAQDALNRLERGG